MEGANILFAPSWDQYFLGMAFFVSMRSKDAQTKHGAIIVDDSNIVLGMGYNSFARGLPDSEYPNTRPEKYPYMIHAEENAIFNCNANLRGIKNIRLYVTGSCCFNCIQRVAQVGIKKIICANRTGTVLEDASMKSKIEKFVRDQNIEIINLPVDFNGIIQFFELLKTGATP
jgi:dCMP deaminase